MLGLLLIYLKRIFYLNLTWSNYEEVDLLVSVIECVILWGGEWATAAVPTRIDIERGNGFLIYGKFGNAGNCSIANKVYVKINHPQYKELYATVLAAYMAGKRVQPYVNGCITVSWYVHPSTTFNTLTSGGALNIMN